MDFTKNINIFYGDNAQGKTNLLEAIYFITTLKPTRAFRQSELILHEQPKAFLKGMFNTSAGPVERKVTAHRNSKKEVMEGGSIKTKWSDLAPSINAIYFSPENIELIKGDPSCRRKFLDGLIYQIRPGFYKYLRGYQRVLAQRNALLKTIRNKSNTTKALEPWNEQLSEFGSQLINERLKLLRRVSLIAKAHFERFTKAGKDLKINYRSEIDIRESDLIKTNLKNELKKSHKRDLLRGFTTVGPHRDDIDFFIDGKPIKNFGSQGQQRLVVLCLKFAHRNLLYTEKGEYPILLLDDVMSELDIHRRQLILEQENHQVFITTTDLKFIPAEILEKGSLFSVKSGVLR